MHTPLHSFKNILGSIQLDFPILKDLSTVFAHRASSVVQKAMCWFEAPFCASSEVQLKLSLTLVVP